MAADDDNAASQLLDSNNLTKYKTAAEIANRMCTESNRLLEKGGGLSPTAGVMWD
jgi:hypothetical protein